MWLPITSGCITIVDVLQYLRAIGLPQDGATIESLSAPNPTSVDGVHSKPPQSRFFGLRRVEIFLFNYPSSLTELSQRLNSFYCVCMGCFDSPQASINPCGVSIETAAPASSLPPLLAPAVHSLTGQFLSSCSFLAVRRGNNQHRFVRRGGSGIRRGGRAARTELELYDWHVDVAAAAAAVAATDPRYNLWTV